MLWVTITNDKHDILKVWTNVTLRTAVDFFFFFFGIYIVK